jgi:2-(3-amino-3-carboxypropyl)histidine synthase
MNANETGNHAGDVQRTEDNAVDDVTGPVPAAPSSSEKTGRRFVGRRRADAAKAGSTLENGTDSCDLVGQNPPFKPKNKVFQAIPTEILENEELNKDLKALPAHYNFEIHKTVGRKQDVIFA